MFDSTGLPILVQVGFDLMPAPIVDHEVPPGNPPPGFWVVPL